MAAALELCATDHINVGQETRENTRPTPATKLNNPICGGVKIASSCNAAALMMLAARAASGSAVLKASDSKVNGSRRSGIEVFVREQQASRVESEFEIRERRLRASAKEDADV